MYNLSETSIVKLSVKN